MDPTIADVRDVAQARRAAPRRCRAPGGAAWESVRARGVRVAERRRAAGVALVLVEGVAIAQPRRWRSTRPGSPEPSRCCWSGSRCRGRCWRIDCARVGLAAAPVAGPATYRPWTVAADASWRRWSGRRRRARSRPTWPPVRVLSWMVPPLACWTLMSAAKRAMVLDRTDVAEPVPSSRTPAAGWLGLPASGRGSVEGVALDGAVGAVVEQDGRVGRRAAWQPDVARR